MGWLLDETIGRPGLRGLCIKKGIKFLIRSEIGQGKPQILV